MRYFGQHMILRDALRGGGPGGGGAAGGEGSPDYTEIDRRIAAGVTAGLDKFGKEKLGAAIQEHVGPINTTLTKLTGSLEQLLAGQGGGTPPPNGGAPPPNGGTPPPNAQHQGTSPEINVQLRQQGQKITELSTQLENISKEKKLADERAERAERHSAIKGALGQLSFVNESTAPDTAFKIVEPHIKRLDDGQLVGGLNDVDNFPVDAFVREFITKDHAYLLGRSGVGGSGAGSNNSTPKFGIRADINDIKQGMKPEQRQATVDAITAVLASQ